MYQYGKGHANGVLKGKLAEIMVQIAPQNTENTSLWIRKGQRYCTSNCRKHYTDL
jgi:hypothetical protein